MTIFVLVDCNNFYASCERLFQPALQNHPIVILSNNDGCIIARSNEAKALGIPMGAPYYQYQKLIEQCQVKVFSSNYALYGSISARVMAILRSSCPDVEIYSIDEAFLQLNTLAKNFAEKLRQHIYQWVGMPVSIGIAPTKTLAKLANFMAKQKSGIFDLRDEALQKEILQIFPIEKIWGIGRRLTLKLNQLGIKNGWELRNYPIKMIRKHFGVTVERIALELQGISCLSLEPVKPKKNIIASRSFGKPVISQIELAQSLSYHTARACEKLRAQSSKAQGIYAFIKTNRFKDDDYYSNGKLIVLQEPTSDTILLTQAAKKALNFIYKTGHAYYKAGIILMDILPATYQQNDLFLENDPLKNLKNGKLMCLIDEVNHRMGSQSLFLAAQGIKPAWLMRNNHCSPKYTTHWKELLRVST